jgi:hypothetical protein
MIDVLIMLPPRGPSEAERWVAAGRLASAQDLLARLHESEPTSSISILAGDPEDRAALSRGGEAVVEGPPGPFHFGRSLATFVAKQGCQALAYFGGASAPLVSPGILQAALTRVAEARDPLALVNNYFSTDWVILNHAERLIPLAELLLNDNALGWVLHHDGGFHVETASLPGVWQMDVDTPADLLLLDGHPGVGPCLRKFVASAPEDNLARVRALRRIIGTPGKILTVIGRTSASIWSQLEKRGQIWVRLFAEERGMVASGRDREGLVRSLIGEMLEAWGPQAFVDRLVSMSDAVLWDTRVWMSHRHSWATVADRYAADLGWPTAIEEPGLRTLTEAIVAAPIPILTGGHGCVSGSLQAFLEALEGA